MLITTITILALLAPVILCLLRVPLRKCGIGSSAIFYLAVSIMWIGNVIPVYLNANNLESSMHPSNTDSAYPFFALFGAVVSCSFVFVVDHLVRCSWSILRGKMFKNNKPNKTLHTNP